MTMSPKVRAEYEKLLAVATLREGSPVLENPHVFGWADYELDVEHRTAECGSLLGFDRVDEESSWTEFVGTFTPDRYVHGVDVVGVRCACGRLNGRTLRWKTTSGEATRVVFELLYSTNAALRAELGGPR